ncbi:hypothetical protein MNBD_NITROSPINAE04-2273 [hydrothermal vent metagenome]|uniref:Phosphate transport system regulatory protein PhoU n=1 Tax=hydrothermal vent metagenome TaxID=652676 RepID=A0A3B1CLK6_9ZZZZ
MTKIIMDEMKKTRDALKAMLKEAQESCRLTIKLIHGEEDTKVLLDRILELEENADNEMVRITEELSEIVGKLFLAGLLKRAVVCDAVVANDAEEMFDIMQHVAENWVRVMESDSRGLTEEIKAILESMLQNCIVMLEKAIDILDGKDISQHTLNFIQEVDGNINQANISAHNILLSMKGDKKTIIRIIRIVKHIENLGDKIKTVSSYLLYIRTGDFIKV